MGLRPITTAGFLVIAFVALPAAEAHHLPGNDDTPPHPNWGIVPFLSFVMEHYVEGACDAWDKSQGCDAEAADPPWDPMPPGNPPPEPDLGPMPDPEAPTAPETSAFAIPSLDPSTLDTERIPPLRAPPLPPAEDVPTPPDVDAAGALARDPDAAAAEPGPTESTAAPTRPVAEGRTPAASSRLGAEGTVAVVDLRWREAPASAAAPTVPDVDPGGHGGDARVATHLATQATADGAAWPALTRLPVGGWTLVAVVLALAGALGLIPVLFLYRRLTAERVLENPVRRRIHEHVCTHPGTTAAQAARAASVHYVTAERHLRTLHEFGHVAAHPAKAGYRYFENHGRYDPGAQLRLMLLREPRNRQLLEAIARSPHSGVTDLARRMGVAKSTVSRRLARLKEAGLVDKRGGGLVCVASEKNARHPVGLSRPSGP